MAKNKGRRRGRKSNQEDDTIIDIVGTSEQVRGFFEEHQNTIIGAVAGLLVLIGLFFAYDLFYKAPLEQTAASQLFKAEQNFRQDSLTKSLTAPDGGYPGFIEMVETYGSTNSGDVSNLYAAISYLKLGKYDVAIDYLNDYDGDGELADVIVNGLKGDAYSELNQLDKALGLYKKAASSSDNNYLSPYFLLKAGMLSEKQGDDSGAKKAYSKIKSKYPDSIQGKDIDKYLERVAG